MLQLYYCVVGIEMGMTCASKIDILATFSTVEAANKYILSEGKGTNYSIVDILETYIDKPNMDLQNSLVLN